MTVKPQPGSLSGFNATVPTPRGELGVVLSQVGHGPGTFIMSLLFPSSLTQPFCPLFLFRLSIPQDIAGPGAEPSRVNMEVTVPGAAIADLWVRRINGATSLLVDGESVAAAVAPSGMYLRVPLHRGIHTVDTRV